MTTSPRQWQLTVPPLDHPPVTADACGLRHLKLVPETAELQQRIREAARVAAKTWDPSQVPTRRQMETQTRQLLAELGLPEGYVGWGMVALASAFWQEQVSAVPYQRRLLLLPHCLRNAETCPADYNAAGLLCKDCGACDLTSLRAAGEQLGYRVLIAEGSPTVMQIVLGGHVDAIVGVACLDALEKTLDKVLLAGIPCLATPLLCNGCRNTVADGAFIRQLIETPYRPVQGKAHSSYVHLMRCAAGLCTPDQLSRLLPSGGGAKSAAAESGPTVGVAGASLSRADEPALWDVTHALALEFLAAGGKFVRPFLTLAAYDALSGGRGTGADGAQFVAALPDAIKSVALAIEVFHKASLVHDDIEDGDEFRYGRAALHTAHGVPTAINVGDYLIGLGYRLVSAQKDALGADVVADILAEFAQAHTRLCAGQGAELAWRGAAVKSLDPLDVLKIYALKTAPAFEAALFAGIRLAGPVEPYRRVVARFARHLGVAYQVMNDLDDWIASEDNKRLRGTDIVGGRPTALVALAMEQLDEAGRGALRELLTSQEPAALRISRTRDLYRRAGVFPLARTLIAKHRDRALEAADESDSEPLRRLLNFLVDAVLAKSA